MDRVNKMNKYLCNVFQVAGLLLGNGKFEVRLSSSGKDSNLVKETNQHPQNYKKEADY